MVSDVLRPCLLPFTIDYLPFTESEYLCPIQSDDIPRPVVANAAHTMRCGRHKLLFVQIVRSPACNIECVRNAAITRTARLCR